MLGIPEDESSDAAKSEGAVIKEKQVDSVSTTEVTDNTAANNDVQNNLDMEDSDSDDEPLIIRKTSTQVSKVDHENCPSDTDDAPQTLQKQSQVDAEVTTNQLNEESKSDSDDDEPIFVRRKGKKSNDITKCASVDSEDEEDTPIAASSILTDSEDEDQQLLVSAKKKGRRRYVLEDDSDMEDEVAETKTGASISDMAGSLDQDENSTERMDTETKGPALFSGDLYDAEDSEDNEDSDSEKKEEEKEEGATRDEGFGESDEDEEDGERSKEMSAKLKKLLAKGAGKKEKKGRSSEPRKSKQNALVEIHSESQRLLRESSVKLPYHKPKPLSLSALLAKTEQKQSQLHSLKKVPGWKNSPELQSLQKAASEPRKRSTKSRRQETSTDIKKTQDKDKLTAQTDTPTEVITNKSSMEVQEEELPDLGLVVRDISKALDEASEKTDCGKTEEVHVVEGTVSEGSKPMMEQDSGILVTPATSSEEENSEDAKTQSDNKEKDTMEEAGDVSCTPTNVEAETPNTLPSVTTLTPKLLGLVVDSVKPCLSGDPDSFIDLDEEEEEDMVTPQPGGIGDLMSRLMKHSKSTHKKARDVELSTVTKEKGKDDKDELKLEKLVYHIEGDEVIDPKLNKPGAKLTALKETLFVQMKVKREEARQKRCEIYDLDNEEGFDNEAEEEEAELTDQTDTDLEEEEFDEEEELIEEEYGAEEEEKKEDNPFVDDEAEDEDNEVGDDDDDAAMDADDEDGEDEESMKLELDIQDKDSSDEAEEKVSEERKDFLKAALLKTNTLTLFDEETIYDATSLSQKEKEQIPEVSDRPFEQLSGDTVKAADDSDRDDDMPDTQPVADLDKGFVPVMDDSSATNMSLLKDKDTSISSVDTSFDVMGTLIPAGQPSKGTAKKYGRITPDLFTPSSKSSVNTTFSTLSKPHRTLSELTLPIEDSQDLYNSPPIRSSQAESTPRLDSQSFHFAFEDDTQSQLLDAEGFFKVKSTEKSVKRQLNLGMNGNSQDMNELLGLCSGKFREATQHNAGDKSSRSVFPGGTGSPMETQGNMDELLGLCSGKFVTEKSTPQKTQLGLGGFGGKVEGPKDTQENLDDLLPLCSGKFAESTQAKKGKKRKPVIEDEDSQDSFTVGSVGETSDREEKEENLDSDEEMEGENEEDKENQDDAETREKAASFKGFKKKRGGIRKEWLEEEAELSGSEYDSDENLDLDEREDIMEEEEGDYDEDVLSDEELRNQVGRVHLKTMMDSDDKQILLYKEMYLQDGDLHSEGGGRMRRFRWKNIDDMSQTDMFGKDSDDEKEDEEAEQENKWRLERHEREKFLEEQKAKELDVDEGSQLLKLGKVIFKPKKDSQSQPVQEQAAQPPPKEKAPAPKATFKVPKNNKGSFLTRSREALAKIAEMTKPVTNPNGPRNSRNFVFSSVNPDEVEEKKIKPVQRSTSVDGSKPPRKRPRLERSNTFSQDSIFNLL